MMRTDRIPVLVCLALATAAARPVMAQAPGQRTLIEAFRDSLERATDSLELARVEARLVHSAKRNRSDPLNHLRLGFLDIRQGDLGASRYYDDAASEFQWVARLAPAWPYAWYGLGLAEYGIAANGPQAASRSVTPSRTEFAKATAAFARAAATDPRFADVLVEDAFAARRQRMAIRPLVLLEGLRLASQSRTVSPLVLPALGRLEREFGDPKAALKAFETWLPSAGRARGLALLEVARTRFLLGRDDGAGPYYDGAAFGDSATVAEYRTDLSYIATESELRAFDQAAGPARVEYLRRFWAVRDAADLRRQGERVREHYRRLYYARRNFPLYLPAPLRELGGRVAFGGPPWDDRGMIYVRHGEPDDRVRLSTLGVEPNESWRYGRAEGDLVLHFVSRQEPEVYRLVESLYDVADGVPQGGADRVSGAATRGQQMLLRSRENLSPFYRRGAAGSGAPEREFQLAERSMSRASLVSAVSSDSYRRRYARNLGAHVDAAVVGTVASGRVLHLAYVLPFDALGAAWLGTGQEYPVRLRLAAFDLEGRVATEMDSTVRPTTLADGAERWLAGMIAVTLPEGRLRLRVAIEDGDTAGSLLPIRSLEVTAPDHSTLGLSDLALGAADGPWRRALGTDGDVMLNPLGILRREDAIQLSYEVSAPGDARLTSQVTVIRTDAQAGVAYNERFNEASGQGPRLTRHVLPLGKLKAGAYRVEVTLSDGRGGLARRWKEFRLAEGKTAGPGGVR